MPKTIWRYPGYSRNSISLAESGCWLAGSRRNLLAISFCNHAVLMTMTEFGRTVRENGSGGTDHSRASCLFVLGTQVDGGKVHGHIPLLAPQALEDQRDLPVITDFRSVFTKVVAQHLSVKNDTIFLPGCSGRRLPLLSSAYSHK